MVATGRGGVLAFWGSGGERAARGHDFATEVKLAAKEGLASTLDHQPVYGGV
jgi:hypothetical protein